MKTIPDIAQDISENEFNDVSGAPSSGVIDSWLRANVGRLNVLINTEFEEESEYDLEAAAIFYDLYLNNYFARESQKVLRGVTTSMGVISVREGDSNITFTNKNEVAKTLKGYSDDYATSISAMVARYTINESFPRDVEGCGCSVWDGPVVIVPDP